MLRDYCPIIKDEAGLVQLWMKSWLEAFAKQQYTVIEPAAASFPTSQYSSPHGGMVSVLEGVLGPSTVSMHAVVLDFHGQMD